LFASLRQKQRFLRDRPIDLAGCSSFLQRAHCQAETESAIILATIAAFGFKT
jgi:hypothetical protein